MKNTKNCKNSNMAPIEFYNVTREMLDTLANNRGIKNVERYYELTEFSDGSFLKAYSGKAQIFAQFAFHAQNATIISNVVRFENNLSFLNDTLCNFQPDEFLKKYPDDNREGSVSKLIDALRFNANTGKGLKWNTNKSKLENKDTIIRRYANSLIDGAVYINSFSNRQEFLDDLLKNYSNKDYQQLIKYFRTRIKSGFSVALTCDFLKEFDEQFCDLPKPDTHIKDTMCALYGLKKNYYSGEKKEYECISDMQALTEDINRSLKAYQKITVFQLDRMIWLICSGKFYLDDTETYKEKYLESLHS